MVGSYLVFLGHASSSNRGLPIGRGLPAAASFWTASFGRLCVRVEGKPRVVLGLMHGTHGLLHPLTFLWKQSMTSMAVNRVHFNGRRYIFQVLVSTGFNGVFKGSDRASMEVSRHDFQGSHQKSRFDGTWALLYVDSYPSPTRPPISGRWESSTVGHRALIAC